MEKNPESTAQPNDHDRKFESGFGSHWRSTSALIPNTVTDIEMRVAEERIKPSVLIFWHKLLKR